MIVNFWKRLSPRAAALLAGVVVTLSVPALALAQEFQKVEGKVTDEVPAGPFVGIAYGFIWVALLAYVLFIARGLGRVRGEMDDLRRKIATALDAASSKR
jgi:CcmD family protein